MSSQQPPPGSFDFDSWKPNPKPKLILPLRFNLHHLPNMSLLPFAFAGGGFILIGAHESLDATLFSTPKSQSQSSSSFFFISLSIFSSSFILNSLISLFDATNSNDAVGTSLQLQLLPIPLIFLFFSLLSLLNTHLGLPSPLLSLLATYAFVSEFLSFYLQRKDAGGVENRYYDLLLVPIAACVLCTCIEWSQSPSRNVAKLGRGIALVLQGTWLVQIGVSLFADSAVAEGCSLHRASRGNYSLRCKGHPEYHRARAIATLQFNCHLALMVVVVVAFYALVCGRNGGNGGGRVDSATYRPLGGELRTMENSAANFTLDDDFDDDKDDVIKEGGGDNVASEKAIVVEHGLNGHGSHHP